MNFQDLGLPDGGVIRQFKLESEILQKTSQAGFSHIRPHTAYLPKEALSGQKLPTIYLLASWLGAGRSMFNWEPFREDLASRVSRLIKTRSMPPCLIVCPDLYIDFGGSQYVNSSYVGNHAEHIISELIPFVENNFPALKGHERRAIVGRSSGGFGALRFGMDYPRVFAAVGCHAGDMGFDWVYRRSLIDLCVALAKYKDPLTYLSEVKQKKKLSGFDTHILMILGMCGFYSPNKNSELGFDLPINLQDGEVLEDTWKRWVDHDPVIKIDQSHAQDHLGSLRELFIDCGSRDQYFLQYGSRQLSKKLKTAGITHSYSEFDDNHSGTSYRYDESLPALAAAIS
jgi:enterochelin esterase-like enzyme